VRLDAICLAMEQALLLITTLPEREAAVALAEGLVKARLAACVNILAECQSVFHWKGTLDSATEVPLLIKTRAALYPAVEQFIVKHHPYEVPEVIAVPIAAGLPAYLHWLVAETASQPSANSDRP
jgi:periplasmic divalent cation tolerance protein